jgi:CheY-like chemotaxis protein
MVFLDLYMPELSGMHAAIAIRSLQSRSPVLVGIASTVDCKEVSLCKDAGMAGVVLKPYDRDSIACLIQTLRPQPAATVHGFNTVEEYPRNSTTFDDDTPSIRLIYDRTNINHRLETTSNELMQNLPSHCASTQPSSHTPMRVRKTHLPPLPQCVYCDPGSCKQRLCGATPFPTQDSISPHRY